MCGISATWNIAENGMKQQVDGCRGDGCRGIVSYRTVHAEDTRCCMRRALMVSNELILGDPRTACLFTLCYSTHRSHCKMCVLKEIDEAWLFIETLQDLYQLLAFLT